MITLKRHKGFTSEAEYPEYNVYKDGVYQNYTADAFIPTDGSPKSYWCEELCIEHCDTYAELNKAMNEAVA